MNIRIVKKIFFGAALFFAVFCPADGIPPGGGDFLISRPVFSATDNVIVNMTVPGGGGGGGGGGGDAVPIISNVVVTTTRATADVDWQATDDKGISSVIFQYGLTEAYGNSGTVGGSYAVSLSGLNANTLYYFRISVTDTGGQTVYYSSSLQTLPAAPPPPDVTPPVISNVVVTPGINSATIAWTTNEAADSQVLYGLTAAYGGNATDANRLLNHTINLANLLPNTVYHFQIISTDAAANSASTLDAIFTTLKDAVPPPDVSNLAIAVGAADMVLTWSNPSLATTPDFSGVKILRKVGSSSANINDGTLVYTGGAQTFTDSNVLVNVDYYYTVFSFDTSDNHSGGVFVHGKIIPPSPPVEICGNGLDDDNNGKTDCADPVCSDLPACQPPAEVCNNGTDDDLDTLIDCADPNCNGDINCLPPPIEICDNNVDDDNDTKIDCADLDCAGLPACQPIVGANPEVCNNGIDDDLDGLTDCADSDCSAFSGCVPPSGKVACEDGIDNDGDGKIDYPDDPGCSVSDDVSELDIPVPTVPGFAHINFSDLIFLGGNRKIRLQTSGETVTSLAGSGFTIGVPKSVLAGDFNSLTVNLGGTEKHQFVYNPADDIYYADLIFPPPGNREAYLEVNYAVGQLDSVHFYLDSLVWGRIQSEAEEFLSGAEVFLYHENNSLVDTAVFGESNPFLTNGNGSYGWIAPRGRYYLLVRKIGFFERKTNVFNVDNNVVNRDVFLIIQPKKLLEVIDPNASLGENTQKIAQNILDKTKVGIQMTGQQISDAAETVNEAADNPVVEETAAKVVAPTVVAVTTMGTVALVSWANILALLRFLFLQPIILLGRRKRETWGEVYNTLNKMPVDLATVRLVEAVTGKIIQSRVTDMAGRYIFMARPGGYRMTVAKAGFVFPSVLLKGFKSDGVRTDIYHGEVIEVKEQDTAITANVPLDPVGATKPPVRIRLEKFGRGLQHAIAWVGLAVTLVSLYISPRWYVWLLLVVHLSTFYLFKRLAEPPKPKGWGIVYDRASKRPIARVVARLFDSQFNKLVGTEITDRRGRYSFLAGDNKYYITYEHNEYAQNKTEVFDLKGKKVDTLAVDVGLEKREKR